MVRTLCLAVAATMALVATPSNAQNEGATATVRLTHNDADGFVFIGETVTWTLEIAFTVANAASFGNMEILGNNALGSASQFEYFEPFGFEFNGGTLGGASNGAGIAEIIFTNSLFLEAFGPAADFSNPKTIGSFDFTASAAGTLQYQFARGPNTIPFLTLDYSPFISEEFMTPEDVTIEIDSLTIVPAPASTAALALAGLLATRRRR